MQHLTEGLVPVLLAVSSHTASHGQALHLIVALTDLDRVGLSIHSNCMLRPTICSFPDSSEEEQGAWPRTPKRLVRTLPCLAAPTSEVRRRRTGATAERRLDGEQGSRFERRLGVPACAHMPTVLGRLWRRTRSPLPRLKPPRLPRDKRLTKMVFNLFKLIKRDFVKAFGFILVN